MPNYTAVKGKLSPGDSREAYVTGPDINGRICPVASFWTFEEAERFAATRNALGDVQEITMADPIDAMRSPAEQADASAKQVAAMRLLAGPPFVPTEAPNAVLVWGASIRKVDGMWEADATIGRPLGATHRASFTRDSRIAVMAEVFAFFAKEGK